MPFWEKFSGLAARFERALDRRVIRLDREYVASHPCEREKTFRRLPENIVELMDDMARRSPLRAVQLGRYTLETVLGPEADPQLRWKVVKGIADHAPRAFKTLLKSHAGYAYRETMEALLLAASYAPDAYMRDRALGIVFGSVRGGDVEHGLPAACMARGTRLQPVADKFAVEHGVCHLMRARAGGSPAP